ncbi:MAG: nucleotidyltransferase [Bacillaceae bacterium]|nr:nucleotidyltransferase [Bacillaceae bacterium]
MDACGVIVEYNPFHNGHVYHLEQSKQKTNKDCMIAVMSGNFLQRGEPAIIDKWHRAKAALMTGVDLVAELPYVYAVQHADLFAKGAVLTLNALKVDTICFGSENGEISPFFKAYEQYNQYKDIFRDELKKALSSGVSFPEASRRAYQKIFLTTDELDLSQPNNILGFSYVKTMLDYGTRVQPETIKRTKSGYHDEEINHQIASATSIRKEILANHEMTERARVALPEATFQALEVYRDQAGMWHHWEMYFPFLQHIVLTRSEEELREIHGVEEGLEFRLKNTVSRATSYKDWMEKLKTKRYTWTRLQRMFAHLLTNSKKSEIQAIHEQPDVPYVRILGMTEKGKQYLNQIKKELEVPMISQLQQYHHPALTIEERAVHSYYLPLPAERRIHFTKREIQAPVLLQKNI